MTRVGAPAARARWRRSSSRSRSPARRSARSADITDADVDLRLAADGSLLVTEHLTFNYDGHFEGSYRDIVLAPRRADHATSRQPGRPALSSPAATRRSAATTAPASSADRGLRRRLPDRLALPGDRRAAHATTSPTGCVGGAVAYDDVIDVGWAVWGDQWDFDLDHLTASFTNPASTRATRSTGSGAIRATSRARPCAATGSRRSRRATSPTTPGSSSGSRCRATPTRASPGPAPEAATACRRSSPRSRLSTTTTTRSSNRVKRFVADHACAARCSGSPRSPRCSSACSPCWPASATSAVPEYLPEPPDDAQPGARLRARPRGRRQHRHGARDAARPRRPRLLRDEPATTDDEKLDLALKQRPNRPAGELDRLRAGRARVLRPAARRRAASRSAR